GHDEVGLTAYGHAREAGRPQGTADPPRRLKRLVPPPAIGRHAAGEVKQEAIEGDVGETEKRPGLPRIDGVPPDGYRMQHRPEEAAGLQDPSNLPEAPPEIGVRERHSRDHDIEPAIAEGKAFGRRTDERNSLRQGSAKPQSIEGDIDAERAPIAVAGDQRLPGAAADVEHAAVGGKGRRVDVPGIGRIPSDRELHQVVAVGHRVSSFQITVQEVYDTLRSTASKRRLSRSPNTACATVKITVLMSGVRRSMLALNSVWVTLTIRPRRMSGTMNRMRTPVKTALALENSPLSKSSTTRGSAVSISQMQTGKPTTVNRRMLSRSVFR